MSYLTNRIDRRRALQLGLGMTAGLAMAPTGLLAQAGALTMNTRAIPSSGELVPLVGVGTARRYDVNPSDAAGIAPLREVIRNIPVLGGSLIDTAPSYGYAETVVGNLVSELGIRDQLFISTKVRAGGNGLEAGKAEIEESFRQLQTNYIDALMVHNLAGYKEMLPYLRDLKDQGRIRYYGVTTSFARQHEEFAGVIANQPMDIIQVDYAIDNRETENRILPLAMDKGLAVQVNVPFGRGRVFDAFGDQPIPEWAAEYDIATWAQFALKWIVSNPAVTSAMPGTAKLAYLEDNLGASRGRLPDEAMRARMAALIESA